MSRHLVHSVIVAIAVTGCTAQAPLSVGDVIDQSGTYTETIVAYRQVGAAEPVPQSISLQVDSESCGSAAMELTSSGTFEQSLEIVGEMPTYHPLSPVGTFNEVIASVVESVWSESGTISGSGTFDIDGVQWTETIERQDYADTWAERYAVAAGEYLVAFHDLEQVWGPQIDDEFIPPFEPLAEIEYEGPEPMWTLLTKVDAGPGDMWPSLDGRILFAFQDREKIEAGDDEVRANRIGLSVVAGYDARQADVFGRCISELTTTLTDSSVVEGSPTTTVTEAYLDPGCQQAFTHLRMGEEWWFDNVLVQSDTTTYEIEVIDHGYQWTETVDEACVRFTSEYRPPEPIVSEPFVEYILTVTERTLETDGWERP